MIFLYAFFFKLFARMAFGNPPHMLSPEPGGEPTEAAASELYDEMQRHD